MVEKNVILHAIAASTSLDKLVVDVRNIQRDMRLFGIVQCRVLIRDPRDVIGLDSGKKLKIQRRVLAPTELRRELNVSEVIVDMVGIQ